MRSLYRNDLEELESEAVSIFREVVSQLENPVLLFSGGKDSILMAWLARLAFQPCSIPFPLLHIDTGHNFPETLQFRDQFVSQMELRLIVRQVEETIRAGKVKEEEGDRPSRNSAQSVTLLEAIRELGFDACFGGGRRDEEKARAKERVFSHRDSFGQWDPKNQRPELWELVNLSHAPGEHFRVFPLSNWTELDVWRYIQREQIPVPTLYFSHQREMVRSRGTLLARSPWVQPLEGESVETLEVRFRTIGDMTCTGAVESSAGTVEDILLELADETLTERGQRADDQRSGSALEDRKRQGYF